MRSCTRIQGAVVRQRGRKIGLAKSHFMWYNKCRAFIIDYKSSHIRKIKDFSTGMQAKLKLLIATSHDADLLILDEPTLGLDVMSREAMLEELQE